MYPVLFSVGGFQIHSFGALMALAWLAAGVYLDAQFKRHGIDRDAVSGFLLWILIGSLAGARLLFLAVEYPAWLEDVAGAVFSRSGFVFYGGFAGGIAAALIYLNKKNMRALAVGDMVAPALALGLGVGRIGCFLAGDDYGIPSDVPWAVTFTHPESLAPLDVALHPTQLYLSLNGFCLFAILHARLGRKAFDGEICALFLMLYSAARFGLEFLRGDPRGFLGPLSTSQWIGLLVFPAGIWLYCQCKGRKQKDKSIERRGYA